MKRFIALFMTVVALIGALAVPASAAEVENGNYIDLLAYGCANGGTSNFIILQPDDNKFIYKLPYQSTPRYVDILFRASTHTPSTVDCVVNGVTNSLTLQSVGDNIFRAYGNLVQADDELQFIFGITGISYVQVLALNVSLNVQSVFPITGYMDINSGSGYDDTIRYDPADAINSREWEPTNDSASNDLQLYLYTENWQKYDFIDYQVLLYCEEINTISAYHDYVILPFQVSHIEGYSNDGEKFFYITIRLDVTGIDRSSDIMPLVRIEGSEGPYGYCAVGVTYMGGGVIYEDNFLTYWFTKITNGISDLFGALSDKSGADDLQQSVDDAGSQLDDIGAAMDSVTRPALDDVNTDVGSIVSQVDINTSTSLLTNVMSNNYISQVLTMVAVLATAGYVLYGKR